MAESLSATALLKMLEQRHSGDVFVPECKDGPTQTRAHLRLDAWVLLKTWNPITTLGYEIKVDRSDWLRDEKVHQYMPLCHLLYVVAPKGLVIREELPAGVGLMEPVGKTGRLQVRHKAARREIQLPAELMVYVLMCRTKITREHGDPTDRNWRLEQLRDWAQGKEERRELSYALNQRIRTVFDNQQRELLAERRRNDELESVRKRIVELGFDPSHPVNQWPIRRRLEEFNRMVDDHTLWNMRDQSKKLAALAESLQQLKDGKADGDESVAS